MTAGYRYRAKRPDEAALRMLELLSQGYGVGEAASMAYEGLAGDPARMWANARKATYAALGAVSDLHAFRRAVERGLIRLEAGR